MEPETSELPWDRGACILLCSDGLLDVLDDSEILEIVQAAESPQSGCDSLVERATQKGNKDDVTVVLVCEGANGL